MLGNGLFAELKRRNVLRAGLLYVGAVWALAQGIAQLGPSVGAPEWITRWFLVAATIGFPFWIAFAWLYEFTPQGLKRESEVAPGDSITHSTGRKLDFLIIGVLALAVVLLLTDRLALHGDAGEAAAAADKSIAVLPLVNASGDQDQLYFSDGLSEDLITALSQFDGLKVISRNSSFKFRDSKESASAIGAKLGVAHLLEGSVRHVGDTVRITAQLVNAADGSTLWSQRYDRPYQDLFALQDEITTAVAGALKARLLAAAGTGIATQGDRPPSGSIEAYNTYLQAKFHYARGTEADVRRAIDLLDAAIDLDPRYAQAWARKSRAWTGIAGAFLSGAQAKQAYARAHAAADTALALAPNLAAAHGARGYVLITADLDWAGAEAEFRRAMQLAPNDGTAKFNFGNLLATLGNSERALDLTRQALATDPLNAFWHNARSAYLLQLGRLDEAGEAIRSAVELQPDAAGAYTLWTIIETQRGDAEAALAAARREPAEGGWREIAMAMALQIGNDHHAADAALQLLIDTQSDIAAYQIAEVYALRDDPDAMFEWLDRSWSNRDPGINNLLYDPLILRYRDDPRLAAFCRKVGLPPPEATTENVPVAART